jgi:hypothetical protein
MNDRVVNIQKVLVRREMKKLRTIPRKQAVAGKKSSGLRKSIT